MAIAPAFMLSCALKLLAWVATVCAATGRASWVSAGEERTAPCECVVESSPEPVSRRRRCSRATRLPGSLHGWCAGRPQGPRLFSCAPGGSYGRTLSSRRPGSLGYWHATIDSRLTRAPPACVAWSMAASATAQVSHRNHAATNECPWLRSRAADAGRGLPPRNRIRVAITAAEASGGRQGRTGCRRPAGRDLDVPPSL
jgi:hypothetical protein